MHLWFGYAKIKNQFHDCFNTGSNFTSDLNNYLHSLKRDFMEFIYMTLPQLLDFLHLQLIFSHFDGVFGFFMGNEQVFSLYFDNFLPLSPRKSGVHTFLQKSHK